MRRPPHFAIVYPSASKANNVYDRPPEPTRVICRATHTSRRPVDCCDCDSIVRLRSQVSYEIACDRPKSDRLQLLPDFIYPLFESILILSIRFYRINTPSYNIGYSFIKFGDISYISNNYILYKFPLYLDYEQEYFFAPICPEVSLSVRKSFPTLVCVCDFVRLRHLAFSCDYCDLRCDLRLGFVA